MNSFPYPNTECNLREVQASWLVASFEYYLIGSEYRYSSLLNSGRATLSRNQKLETVSKFKPCQFIYSDIIVIFGSLHLSQMTGSNVLIIVLTIFFMHACLIILLFSAVELPIWILKTPGILLTRPSTMLNIRSFLCFKPMVKL